MKLKPAPRFRHGGQDRQADGFRRGWMVECKDVLRQGYTAQLKAYYWYARMRGFQLMLVVRPWTKISKKLQAMHDRGMIKIVRK
ncbi:MAG: putative toxin [Pirellulaceae bacterium]